MFAAGSAEARKKPPVEQPAPLPSPAMQALAVGMPEMSAVAAYYSRWQGPAWFAPANSGAIQELATILRRSPLDGLAGGPALAERVEQAAAAARSGNAA